MSVCHSMAHQQIYIYIFSLQLLYLFCITILQKTYKNKYFFFPLWKDTFLYAFTEVIYKMITKLKSEPSIYTSKAELMENGLLLNTCHYLIGQQTTIIVQISIMAP